MHITAGAAGAGALCVVLISGCAGAFTDHHTAAGAPVHAVAPSRAPAAAGRGGCVLQGAAPDTDTTQHGLVSVDRSPSGVVIVWVPGSNQRPCRAELVDAGPVVARRLATAIDTAPAIPRESSACGAADDTEADLYFLYPGQPGEQAQVGLSGCESVGAPGRAPRQLSDDLAAALLPLTPGTGGPGSPACDRAIIRPHTGDQGTAVHPPGRANATRFPYTVSVGKACRIAPADRGNPRSAHVSWHHGVATRPWAKKWSCRERDASFS